MGFWSAITATRKRIAAALGRRSQAAQITGFVGRGDKENVLNPLYDGGSISSHASIRRNSSPSSGYGTSTSNSNSPSDSKNQKLNISGYEIPIDDSSIASISQTTTEVNLNDIYGPLTTGTRNDRELSWDHLRLQQKKTQTPLQQLTELQKSIEKNVLLAKQFSPNPNSTELPKGYNLLSTSQQGLCRDAIFDTEFIKYYNNKPKEPIYDAVESIRETTGPIYDTREPEEAEKFLQAYQEFKSQKINRSESLDSTFSVSGTTSTTLGGDLGDGSFYSSVEVETKIEETTPDFYSIVDARMPNGYNSLSDNQQALCREAISNAAFMEHYNKTNESIYDAVEEPIYEAVEGEPIYDAIAPIHETGTPNEAEKILQAYQEFKSQKINRSESLDSTFSVSGTTSTTLGGDLGDGSFYSSVEVETKIEETTPDFYSIGDANMPDVSDDKTNSTPVPMQESQVNVKRARDFWQKTVAQQSSTSSKGPSGPS